MTYGLRNAAFGALVFGGLLAGCATTVETSSPIGSYRYHYDSRVVYDTSPAVVYREPAVTYREPVVTYREPVVTYREPVVTYREPVLTYSAPAPVYRFGRAFRVDDDD